MEEEQLLLVCSFKGPLIIALKPHYELAPFQSNKSRICVFMTNGHFFVVSKFSLSLNVGRQRGCLCVLCRLDPDSRIFSTCNLLPEGYKFHLGGISSHVQYKTKQRLLEQIELFYNLKREKKKNRSSAVFLLRPFELSSDIAQCILASVSENYCCCCYC